jgi:DNA-binding XRE family transcriptional regulator
MVQSVRGDGEIGEFAVPTLAELRHRAFLTQAELAEQAGVSTSTIASIERGENPPRPSTARALAAALGVRPGDIDWPVHPAGRPAADA